VDVVRHHLVQRIVRAYDSYGRAQQIPLELGDAALADAVEQGTGIMEQGAASTKPQ
jgi:phosphate starvation-inducible PhoH-like protein